MCTILKHQTIKNSDFLFKIGISKKVESLNISNSAAVVFHHIDNCLFHLSHFQIQLIYYIMLENIHHFHFLLKVKYYKIQLFLNHYLNRNKKYLFL